jgi:hypothetical protein
MRYVIRGSTALNNLDKRLPYFALTMGFMLPCLAHLFGWDWDSLEFSEIQVGNERGNSGFRDARARWVSCPAHSGGEFPGIPVHLVVYFLIPKCKDHKSEERCVEGNRTVKARLWGITSESA